MGDKYCPIEQTPFLDVVSRLIGKAAEADSCGVWHSREVWRAPFRDVGPVVYNHGIILLILHGEQIVKYFGTMEYRIYLDTHFIDYLLDHKELVWEGNHSSIEKVVKKDRSRQINEYLTLQVFPLLCWLNNWHLVVGDCVLNELNKIKDRARKKALIDYVEQLQALAGLRLDYDVDDIINEGLDQQTTEESQLSQSLLPGFIDVPRLLDKGLTLLPSKDRPLVREAVSLSCDLFLTTDSKLLNYGQDAEQYLRLRIRKPTEFLFEEDRRGRIKYFDDVINIIV